MKTRRFALAGLLALGLSGALFSQIHLPFSKGPKATPPAAAPAPTAAPAPADTTAPPSTPAPAPPSAASAPTAPSTASSIAPVVPSLLPPSAPGIFDFYLLSLSWAPQFCSAPDEAQRNPAECARGKGISFSVHGLWPETNQGASPESCARGKNIPAMVPKPVINLILDYMYSAGLIQHEWTTHGLCTGLTPSDYFTDVLQARSTVQLPVEFSGLDQTIQESPAQIEAQFARSNELLPAQAFRTACAGGALAEVRVCLDKNLKAEACPARVADCTSPSLTILPVR